MGRFFILTTVLALFSLVHAQCGSGTPDARVTGSGSSFTATRGSSTVYTGSDYRAAIQAAVDSISSGQRVSVIASGSIGANTITIGSGKTFEGCGTINVANRSGRGAIEVLNTVGTKIPYLTMTGNPYFGLRFYGTRDLVLGQITMNLSGGRKCFLLFQNPLPCLEMPGGILDPKCCSILCSRSRRKSCTQPDNIPVGIRFDRDQAANSNVKIDTVRVTGAGSHAVETWNIDGLTIVSSIPLLLQFPNLCALRCSRMCRSGIRSRSLTDFLEPSNCAQCWRVRLAPTENHERTGEPG